MSPGVVYAFPIQYLKAIIIRRTALLARCNRNYPLFSVHERKLIEIVIKFWIVADAYILRIHPNLGKLADSARVRTVGDVAQRGVAHGSGRVGSGLKMRTRVQLWSPYDGSDCNIVTGTTSKSQSEKVTFCANTRQLLVEIISLFER